MSEVTWDALNNASISFLSYFWHFLATIWFLIQFWYLRARIAFSLTGLGLWKERHDDDDYYGDTDNVIMTDVNAEHDDHMMDDNGMTMTRWRWLDGEDDDGMMMITVVKMMTMR